MKTRISKGKRVIARLIESVVPSEEGALTFPLCAPLADISAEGDD